MHLSSVDDCTRIRTHREDGILTLTLDRPEHGNAVDDDLHSELAQVFALARADDSVRVVVLTGAGRSFCLGTESGVATPGIGAVVDTLLDLDQPLIAAVNGDAFGVGAVLATLADVAYVAASARIGAGDGPTARDDTAAVWPAIVGVNRAKFLVMNGETLAAAQAVECGLLHRAVPHGTALQAARDLARQWAAQPPAALQRTKAVLNRHVKAAVATALSTRPE
ncbi:enoyl-CoA hydratase/isomerase family protein [Pseudonocardia sp. MH-G8]|uniref:enoyl-CoA hydratase/isomerase family protein n=1 Tax=Pseudonocardia sp. MH-G8 TaxID=1854588 RepID=UPI000B9FA3F7|nr:enoyl-CoA hydratase/isomerase family protein [Pseudonocardia sp. MH-G8]OZM79306.1 enoyl-CoA hydratase [Pseudonocardia sp. MH-G8]